MYLNFEKSSWKNHVRRTGFLACKNQVRRTGFLACKNQFRNSRTRGRFCPLVWYFWTLHIIAKNWVVFPNLPFWNHRRCHYILPNLNDKFFKSKESDGEKFSLICFSGLLKIIANKHDYNLTGFVLFQKTIMCSSRHNLIHCFVHIFSIDHFSWGVAKEINALFEQLVEVFCQKVLE